MTELIVIQKAELETLIEQSLQKAISLVQPPQKQEEEELLTRKQVCAILKITYPTLNRMEKTSTLIPSRIYKELRYKKSDVNALLNKKGNSNAI